MAVKLKAINTYRPKIERAEVAENIEITDQIAGRTGLTRGQVALVLDELHESIIHFARSGRSVKIDGLGLYYAKISLAGDYRISHIPANSLHRKMNIKETFTGTLINKNNVGKTPEELVELWNQEHPDDLVVP
jgi:hypothetical protein